MDSAIRAKVIGVLEADPALDERHIGVAVAEGVVTLTGHVPTYEQKLAAESAALRVEGAKAIANELEVRTADQSKTADDEIATRAVDILTFASLIPAHAIKVTVRHGRVILSGYVGRQDEVLAAAAAVRKLSGVASVDNDLMIRPEADATDIKARIAAALRQRASVEADNIKVIVEDGGRIVLEGVVDNWDERQAVDSAASSVPGVHTVENRVHVR